MAVGFKSTYLCNKMLDLVYSATGWTPPATLYCALFTTIPSPGGTGGVEPSGSGYARIAVTNNATNFPAASSATKSNATIIDFGTPTGSGWGVIVGAGWYDASTAGNLISAGPFSVTKTAVAGSDFQIPVSGFQATET